MYRIKAREACQAVFEEGAVVKQLQKAVKAFEAKGTDASAVLEEGTPSRCFRRQLKQLR